MQGKRITTEDMVAMGVAFYQEVGRLPRWTDVNGRARKHRLPHVETIYKNYPDGGLYAYQEAVLLALGISREDTRKKIQAREYFHTLGYSDRGDFSADLAEGILYTSGACACVACQRYDERRCTCTPSSECATCKNYRAPMPDELQALLA